MIHMVLASGGFYYSCTFDLSHSLQWLSENASLNFRQLSMLDRVTLKLKNLCIKKLIFSLEFFFYVLKNIRCTF